MIPRRLGLPFPFFWALLFIPLLFPFASCSQESPESSTLHFALASKLGNFDPVQSGTTGNQVLQRQCFEGLLQYNPDSPDFEIIGSLAENWEVSKDQRTWLFYLRTDAQFFDPAPNTLWENGKRPVTATDVLTSWLRLADAGEAAVGWFALEGLIEGLDAFRHETAKGHIQSEAAWAQALDEGLPGLRVLSDNRFAIRLTRPDPTFAYRLASPYLLVYPREALMRSSLQFSQHPVGSGPYFLKEWEPGFRALFAPVPNHPRPPRSTAQLEFLWVPQGSTRTLMFQNGELDRLSPLQDSFATLIDGHEPNAELRRRGVNLTVTDMLDLTMLQFNMNDPVVGHLPNDKKGNHNRALLRKALALAFPYKQWNQVVRAGAWGKPATRLLPPGLPESKSIEDIPWRKEDTARALELLSEAGWPKAKGLPILRLELGGTDPTSRDLGTMLTAAWKRIGIHLEVVAQDYGDLVRKMNSGQAQISTRAWTLDWPDAANLLDIFCGEFVAPGINKSNFQDSIFDQALRSFKASTDSKERATFAKTMIGRLTELAPVIPIDHRQSYLLTQPWLELSNLNPFDPLPCASFGVNEQD
ncbi:MAG: ABC transporter substrate-binding protein [Planctomycetota bacterium]|nr:ABC transporter substrate-binding protein [Planctomycetota bacterium]MDP6941023.1 ABC transporter substrate-binding protein [Planctomycetota bacterium]